MALTRCRQCNAQVSDQATKCPNCGYPLKGMNCPECGKRILLNSKECNFCGYPIRKKEEEKLEAQRKATCDCSSCTHFLRNRFIWPEDGTDEEYDYCSYYDKRDHFGHEPSNCDGFEYSNYNHTKYKYKYKHSESEGCYLTTACVEHYGLPDTCEELETLRWFRDNIMVTTLEGKLMVEEYYRIAPVIVAQMNLDKDSDFYYSKIFEVIQQCVVYIKEKKYDQAKNSYVEMTMKLKQKYCL